MASQARLVDAAMRLRAQAPEGWEEFVFAMREYAAAQTAEMVKCPLEMLQKAQGMAHTANDLAQTFQNAPKLYEKQRNG
jgi:hypothetical protein